MITITTRRHPTKFYGIVIFLFLMCFIIGTIILYPNLEKIITEGSVLLSNIIFILIGGGLYAMGVYVPYSYWRNAPKIIINEKKLQVGKQVYDMKGLKRVKLTGKELFSSIITYPKEATTLFLKENFEVIIFDEFYANSYEVKLFLEQTFIKKEAYSPIQLHSYSIDDIQFESEEIFKGKQFNSLRGILLWGLTAYITVMSIIRWQSVPGYLIIIMAGIVIYMFIVFSWSMYYFGVTKNYLIVRNHIPIWTTKVYRLSDIKEIILENPPYSSKAAKAMRIITKDSNAKKYPAGTLKVKTWHTLRDKLTKGGVNVRNEIF